MVAWLDYGNDETPQSTGIKGDHFVEKYYVKFDQEYKKEIAALIEKGIAKDEAEKTAPILLKAQDMSSWRQRTSLFIIYGSYEFVGI